MTNFNDAEITNIYVSQTKSAGVQDDAPNAPTVKGPFDLTVEMVAGYGLNTGGYTLTISCADLTAMTPAPAKMIPAAPFGGAAAFGAAPWKNVGPNVYLTFAHNETVNATSPAGGDDHVYQYTASLVNGSGQVASIKQSEPFVLY